MIDGYTEKTPTENKYFDADFAAEIPSGDSIRAYGAGSATQAVVTDSTGASATGLIIGGVSISSTKVRLRLQSGLDGMNYLIVVTAEMTTAGTKFEKTFELRVRAKRRTS